MSAAQQLPGDYTVLCEGAVLCVGRAMETWQVERAAKLLSAFLVCTVRVNSGTQRGQRADRSRMHRSEGPRSLAGFADVPKVAEGRNVAGDGL